MFQGPLIYQTIIGLLAWISDGLKNEIIYLLGPGLGNQSACVPTLAPWYLTCMILGKFSDFFEHQFPRL